MNHQMQRSRKHPIPPHKFSYSLHDPQHHDIQSSHQKAKFIQKKNHVHEDKNTCDIETRSEHSTSSSISTNSNISTIPSFLEQRKPSIPPYFAQTFKPDDETSKYQQTSTNLEESAWYVLDANQLLELELKKQAAEDQAVIQERIKSRRSSSSSSIQIRRSSAISQVNSTEQMLSPTKPSKSTAAGSKGGGVSAHSQKGRKSPQVVMKDIKLKKMKEKDMDLANRKIDEDILALARKNKVEELKIKQAFQLIKCKNEELQLTQEQLLLLYEMSLNELNREKVAKQVEKRSESRDLKVKKGVWKQTSVSRKAEKRAPDALKKFLRIEYLWKVLKDYAFRVGKEIVRQKRMRMKMPKK